MTFRANRRVDQRSTTICERTRHFLLCNRLLRRAVASILSIGCATYLGSLLLFPTPLVEALPPSDDRPLDPLFKISNPSAFLTMRSLAWICSLLPLDGDDQALILDLDQFSVTPHSTDLPPGAGERHSCIGSGPARDGTFEAAVTIEFETSLRALGFKRVFRRRSEQTLIWRVENARGRWTE